MYGRQVFEMAGSVESQRLKFRAASIDWHHFLGFKKNDDLPYGTTPWYRESQAVEYRRRLGLQRANLLQSLRDMTGRESAVFHGLQQEILEDVVAGESRILAIMPTGGGNSILFQLPAWIGGYGGTTVVLVPLVSLRHDMRRRCLEVGLSCVEWESARQADEAAIVLVTPESAAEPAFQRFLNRQIIKHLLDRVVIDECYNILNPQRNFRAILRRQGTFGISTRTQLIFLTATLPPEHMPLFLERIQLYIRSGTDWRRGIWARILNYRDGTNLSVGFEEAFKDDYQVENFRQPT